MAGRKGKRNSQGFASEKVSVEFHTNDAAVNCAISIFRFERVEIRIQSSVRQPAL